MKTLFCKYVPSFCLTLFLIGLTSYTTQAQQRVTYIGVAPQVAFPMFDHNTNFQFLGNLADVNVDFNDNMQTGFGVTGRIQHDISRRVCFIAEAGYLQWRNDITRADLGNVGSVAADLTNLRASVTAIPAQAGFKVFLTDGLYGMAQAGIHHVTNKLEASLLVDLSSTETFTEFSATPGIGYEFNLGGVNLDLGARYQFVGNKFNYAGISAALNFPVARQSYNRRSYGGKSQGRSGGYNGNPRNHTRQGRVR